MITTATPRRRAGQRIASALWALLVIGAGVMMAVAFSGTTIDLELAAIIALGAVGGWLILSAALSSIGRSREVRAATAPVVEEPLHDAAAATETPDADAAPTSVMPGSPSQPTPTEVIFTEAGAATDPDHDDGEDDRTDEDDERPRS
ncbi:hypothetical protein [Demequina sp. NBRC 110055]|uniref:hypothetical protein n=1 Tax=Demequina sp. NBRC 110055 TaxID=1570344 RepID=UPI000A069763|nr:hypothetical protein [Demequina sp. NBRC 110055]